MESFPAVATCVLEEFGALLHLSPCPLGSICMLQIITVNMFTIHYAQTRGIPTPLPLYSYHLILYCAHLHLDDCPFFLTFCIGLSFSGKGQEEARSVLEEQSTSLGLAMFGLLVQRCTELLKETPAGDQ